MLRVRAFQGLRPAPQFVEEVACVPYDVVNRQEAATLAEGRLNSLLHVDRAEIDLPPETNPYSDEVYGKALQNFAALQSNGTLLRETEPCLFIYQQRMGEHVQTGIAGVCHIDDYERNIIKKHEKTRPDKEDDRTRLIGTINANTGPVFLTYRDSPDLDRLASAAQGGVPIYNFTAPDGVQHTVWRLAGGQEISDAFRSLPAAYVADGHHRTASAVRVGRERRAASASHTGEEEYNWFLCVLFPASQLQILPYNRVIRDLNGLSKEAFLQAIAGVFTVSSGSSPAPQKPGEIRMYLAGVWYALTWTPPPGGGPISQLDVTGLQENLLAPVLGISDPRTSERIDFIGGIRGTDELVRLVDSGRSSVAFSMYPTTVDQLMAIADAGEIMPPKSTWFEPKLRSGLFIHTF
jgi:uncharacterized protein (DUF1015 family)